jgi:beta-galactosidase
MCVLSGNSAAIPWWLLKEEDLKVRSMDPRFIDAYRNYVHQVAEQLTPLLIENGGPIIMVQIENEYGFYGNDKEYLALNRDIFIEAGFNGELFTCDPPYTIDAGHLAGTYAAVNGGARPAEVMATQDRINGPGGPYFVSEWYPAWFDVWGKTASHFSGGRFCKSPGFYFLSWNFSQYVHGAWRFQLSDL